MAHDAAGYRELIVAAATEQKSLEHKAEAYRFLTEFFPDDYFAEARKAALAILAAPHHGLSHNGVVAAFTWLVKNCGAAVLPEIEHFFVDCWAYCLKECLRVLGTELGPAGAPGMEAATRYKEHDVRLAALAYLVNWNQPGHEFLIRTRLEEGLAVDKPDDVVRYITLAGRWQPAKLADPLWQLFSHKSKPVRQAAARALGRIGDEVTARGIELLSAKKADTRGAAVTLLSVLGSPAALTALENRLDVEADEAVRDQILLALEESWEAAGRSVTREMIDERIARTLPKLQSPAAAFVDEGKLPPLRFTSDGATLPANAVRYLLYRQSRAKEVRADVEVKPLLTMIDRRTSGDFALGLLRQFAASAMSADDRWAMTLAGLLGDDRVVPVVMQLIRNWVDNNRGKLAEYAVQAMALLGTDAAMCAVDALSIRYRSKQKNVGKAATDAFAEAAERLGLTVDELGDRVVPWLGFEAGKPRLIEDGDKRLEVRISLDHKLEFRDLAKGKKVASLPAWVPAEVKTEFKDLGATIREVLKGQLARLENLMVRQFRWPVARWRELYLLHPLLFPFAVRLAWGAYDAEGQLLATFRALEDRTLTDAQDESVELPEGVSIGLVHPMELSEEQRNAWINHLADYKIVSPFLQMERPVIRPAEEERAVKLSSKYTGHELNAMTFKSRAERLGWVRSSVVDGGGITAYRKSFPGAGAEVILGLDGMYIGIDRESSIRLEKFGFVKAGTVSYGSYLYDEPGDESDERLISFGETPPLVYSETLGDLAKITGMKDGEDEV